ncbi:unnamed protein product [Adineta ricciae]|uniref:DOMON domain-containing protein n=1 Tax=Adineta ricciae TaxID=249248 RepID=A0A813U9H8_ADIRI|nr:unnamed protein product [Adineta ricciae]
MANSVSFDDNCSGRWQLVDKLNIKITFDWQIYSETNKFITEFRANHVKEGFWYGFGFSSSSNGTNENSVYVLRRRENESEIFWDIYNVTQSDVIVIDRDNSSLVTFQPVSSSGLLTVQSQIDEQECSYFVYMRGRFLNDKPLLPDEIRSNQSLCLTCQRLSSISTMLPSSIDATTDKVPVPTSDYASTVTPTNSRQEVNFIWFGRILNRSWSTDYRTLNSVSSQQLRLDLQNFFLLLISSTSPLFICQQFELLSLESGSILFASNISLISNLSRHQTIHQIQNLINTVNNSKHDRLHFDSSAHTLKPASQISQLDHLFKQYSSSTDMNFPKQAQFDSTFHLLVGCIVGVGLLMTVITTILCLYGYYKCRRRQFRHYTEQQTIKFKTDIDSYTWLGQQPSISCSSPYLIQSTSI